MDSAYHDNVAKRLAALDGEGRRRRLATVTHEDSAVVWRDGRRLVNFSSNDYLGLARHPALVERARAWAVHYGTGATASRLVCGTLEPHARVEARLAALKGTEGALVMNAGFQANQAVLHTLLLPEVAGDSPLVFADRLNHASMHEGLRTAGVRQIRFRHNDLDHLESLLRRYADAAGPRFIVTESVFSMDGDRADLAGLCDLAERHGCFLYVDDAHATGVLGPGGAGLTAEPGVAGRIDCVMGTFGKALGGFGACIATSAVVRDWLINRCGGFLYTTALPPPVLGAVDAALDLLPDLDAARDRVAGHAESLRRALNAAGIDTLDSSTQIVPAVMGDAEAALAAQAALETAGCLAVAIRPPTVPRGTSRLRLALSAAHTDAHVATLAGALAPQHREAS